MFCCWLWRRTNATRARLSARPVLNPLVTVKQSKSFEPLPPPWNAAGASRALLRATPAPSPAPRDFHTRHRPFSSGRFLTPPTRFRRSPAAGGNPGPDRAGAASHGASLPDGGSRSRFPRPGQESAPGPHLEPAELVAIPCNAVARGISAASMGNPMRSAGAWVTPCGSSEGIPRIATRPAGFPGAGACRRACLACDEGAARQSAKGRPRGGTAGRGRSLGRGPFSGTKLELGDSKGVRPFGGGPGAEPPGAC